MDGPGPIRLHVGDRSLDEASLPAYLVLAQAKVPFERVTHEGVSADRPCLEEGGARHVGLLAIADRVAIIAGARAVWPVDAVAARALVERSLVEWGALREAYPYALVPPLPAARPTLESARDLDALASIVNAAPSNGLLFGTFSVVDAALAPLAVRIRAHGIGVGPRVTAWVDAVLALPAMERWIRRARES